MSIIYTRVYENKKIIHDEKNSLFLVRENMMQFRTIYIWYEHQIRCLLRHIIAVINTSASFVFSAPVGASVLVGVYIRFCRQTGWLCTYMLYLLAFVIYFENIKNATYFQLQPLSRWTSIWYTTQIINNELVPYVFSIFSSSSTIYIIHTHIHTTPYTRYS